MLRRTFFKSLALSVAAAMTPKMTAMEAKAASEIPTPKPLLGRSAFVTTVKGPTVTVQHNLHSPLIFAVACDLKGNYCSPKVEPIDSDSVKLVFTEPWHLRRNVYKVVLSGIRAAPTTVRPYPHK